MSDGTSERPELDGPDDVLAVETTRGDGRCRVAVHGEVDAHTADQLRDHLEALSGEPTLELDLSGVGFMDSSGLRVLIAAKRQVTEHGGTLEVVDASRPLVRLFEIAGVAGHLGLPDAGAS